MNISSLSKVHFEVSRQQFNSFVGRTFVPKTSYYVASLMRSASEESLENKSKILSRLLTVGWIAGAALCSVGSAIQNILSDFSSPSVLLLTLKEGDGKIHCADGRAFYLWSDQVLREIFTSLNLKMASFFRNVSAIGSNEPWLGYVLTK